MSKSISKIAHKFTRSTIVQNVSLHSQLLMPERKNLQKIMSLSSPTMFCVKDKFTP